MDIMDIIIIIILAGAMFLGFQRGLVLQLVSLVGLVIAFVVAYVYYSRVAAWLGNIIALHSFKTYEKFDQMLHGINLENYIYNAIAFILLFIGVKIVLNWIGQLLNAIFKVPGLHFINRWGGAVFSFLEAVVLIVLLIEVLKVIPQDQIQQQLHASYFANMLSNHMSILPKAIQQMWNQHSA